MIRDALDRPLGSLRLSVTDRCNMRCRYCMPNESYVWLPRASLLTFEELDRVADLFGGLGARRLRLTGGEPLLRQDLARLIGLLAAHDWLDDLAMTTNGILLAPQAAELVAAGLRRVTVSLDTLVPERMERFARSAHHARVLEGIGAAKAAGFESVKLNSVVVRGYNDDEIESLLGFAIERGLELRFIEYMDVGGASEWSAGEVVSREEILARVSARFGSVRPLDVGRGPGGAPPAEAFELENGARFGVIASTTAPFCRTCDRSRLTADGTWYHCLYADRGIDLREPLRAGAADEQLRQLIADAWRRRIDRGAELRAAEPERGVLYTLEGLKDDPRREMHTRGG
ncbi:MAG: GTP 3',8-cyclase MoaA [Gemmatimonadales bacterium]